MICETESKIYNPLDCCKSLTLVVILILFSKQNFEYCEMTVTERTLL